LYASITGARGVALNMGFHNHLHAKPTEKHEIAPHVYPFIAVLGLVGMIFTIIGNIMQTKEMYPSYLQSNEGAVFHVPVSFFFSIFSDLCLVLYGILSQDIIIILYGVLNSAIILLTMVYIRRKHIQNESIFAAAQTGKQAVSLSMPPNKEVFRTVRF